MGITSPSHAGFLSGVGAFFSLDSPHKLANGSVVEEGGVHVSVAHGHGQASISTQIAALRRLLLRAVEGSEGEQGEASEWLQRVVNVSSLSSYSFHRALMRRFLLLRAPPRSSSKRIAQTS